MKFPKAKSEKFDPAYEKALRRIEACAAEGEKGTQLDLSGLQLTAVPPELCKLSSLTTLDLSSNQLASLPPELGKLSSLTELNLSFNRLASLPPELGKLSSLTELNLSFNRLASLPPELGKLSSLTTLYLYNNQLASLPPEIGNLSSLTTLYLYNNQLARLPPELGNLSSLTKLDLHNNQLASLPQELGKLSSLTHLSLSSNQLASLPPELGKLSSLTTLFLYNNQLASLPPELGKLSSLTHLYLHGNPGLGLPDSILGPTSVEVFGPARKPPARPADILRYYFAQREAARSHTLRPVHEIKVMLVGRGGAGKTSLRRYFMGEPHDAEERETRGIALDHFPLPCGDALSVKVRLWDFAGQEITHALHHFFLTEGCIYILVLDPRSNTEMQDAEYWLALLKRYAKESPVLITMNKQDAREGGYDVDRANLQERFPHIHSFTPTNCSDRRGCDELKARLCEALASLKATEPPHLQVPEAWLHVMQDCDSEQTKQKLTLEEFRQICAQRLITEGEAQESLARLLHALGAVLHFVDDPRLRDTSVLKPHWVTDSVYRLLRYKDGPTSRGILTLAEARRALVAEGENTSGAGTASVSEETARFFLRLMERFEMCFPMEAQEHANEGAAAAALPQAWLIPGAMTEFQPSALPVAQWQPGMVRLRYIYDPLPEGVLPRFIVNTHVLSEPAADLRWRHGVVLHEGQARALVRRGQNRNHIEISAHGPAAERLRLLQIVQGTLERIHQDLPEPRPYAEQELKSAPGVYRRISELEDSEIVDVQVVVNTGGERRKVDPSTELNQASTPESRDPDRVPLRAYLSYSGKNTRYRDSFLPSLTVMMKKKLISPWHDGLIEPGRDMQREIEEQLQRMDIFIGLLTVDFLACDEIEAFPLAAARARLEPGNKGRDFLFILIQVDDVPLKGLDLAAYKILVPGGKPVKKHPSLRDGFIAAQRELEELIERRMKR